MACYFVIELVDPVTLTVLHVCRQSDQSSYKSSLYHLIQGARDGTKGLRFERTRALRAAGNDPVMRAAASGLTKANANVLVDRLRDCYGIHLSRRGVRRPRVHKQADPSSPYLDPTSIYYVYEMIRPDTDEVFYVGKGSDRYGPRIKEHVRKAKKGKKGHKFSVIRKLLKMGLQPVERRIAEDLTESQALKLEVARIDEIGLDLLTNDASGGQTAPTGDEHWTRKHPEKLLRGENHPWAKSPELAERNIEKMQAALKADPSKRPRGERHGMSKLSRKQVLRIRERYQQGLDTGNKVTGQRLALDYEVSEGQISSILRGKTWGLPSLIERHGNAKVSAAQRDEIKQRRAAGVPYYKIAKAFDLTTNAVFSICNPGPAKNPNTTDRPGNAKLSNAQIDEMVARYFADVLTQEQLGKSYGISRSQVIRILHARGIRRKVAAK